MSVIEFHRTEPEEDDEGATLVGDAVELESETTACATQTAAELARIRGNVSEAREVHDRQGGTMTTDLASAAELGAVLRRALEAAHPAGRFVIVAIPADAGQGDHRQAPANRCASVVRERLAGILAADMVGYTRLMAADERGTLAGLEDARLVFRSCIEAHAGRVVDMAGDSVLATFDTATGALRAALAAQARLRADAAPLAANRRVQFRVGVHVGDIIEKTDGTVYGDGVNIAARLQALADPAEVWVSDSARGAIGSRVAASYQVCGRHRVKDAARTVIAYRAVEAPSGAAGGLVAS